MPRQVARTVYTFDELSDEAKEKARNWFHQFIFTDSNDWKHVLDDAVECGKLIGIEIGNTHIITRAGKIVDEPAIYFSGFASQGDGASYVGRYRYAKGGLKAIKAHAPEATELHRIAKALQDVQRKYFYKLVASMSQRGFYLNSASMKFRFEHADDINTVDADDVAQALCRFADWIYRQLEKEYDYQGSDECLDENILSNGYEFDDRGCLV